MFPQSIRKSKNGFKDNFISFFKANTLKQTMNRKGKKLCKPKTQKKINNIRNPFMLKKKKKIKDRITREIWTLFEKEEEKKKN